MKQVILNFAVCLQLACPLCLQGQLTWQIQGAPVNENLISVCFSDTAHGWIATDNGTVLYTGNAGKDWETRVQIENFMPTKLWFSNTQLGWISGKFTNRADTAFILRTVNGGSDWEIIFDGAGITLNDLFFINDTMGWTVGWERSGDDPISLILYTVNGGDSWIMPQGPRIMNELYSVHFRDINYGQACGQDGIFFTTNNGGRNELSGWAMNIAIPSYGKDLYDIFNGGDNYGCAVGEGGFVLFTKDKWANNLDYNTASGDTLLAVTGLTDGTGFWAAGKNGYVAGVQYSFLGLGVFEEDHITSCDLNDIITVSDHHIWAVGDNGTIMFRGMNPTGMHDNVIQKHFYVFPNPAKDNIRISYMSNDNVNDISLFSADGKSVQLKQYPGTSTEKVLDVSGLSEGFYLLKVNNEVYKITICR
jgi:photosystem II stability/assembly factor-like uncharacterized protein